MLLENKDKFLPLRGAGKRVFLYQVDSRTASRYGFIVVDSLDQADMALVRASAPFETLHPNYMFGSMQHEGWLDFSPDIPEFQMIVRASARVPTVVSIYSDRPAILTRIHDRVSAPLANFGASDRALFDVVTGNAKPEGRLPFELPSSMEEVEAQAGDLPQDTVRPLYKLGFGLSY